MRTISLSVLIREEIQATNFDSTLKKTNLQPSLVPYEATLGVSENDMRWILIEKNGGLCGWPFRALARLIENDIIRVYRNGEEVSTVTDL